MNKSSNPKGEVTVTVFRPDGHPYLIVVPKTWIPICITDQVSHDTVNNSDDFRRNLNNGMLELLSVEEAKKRLSDPDAMEESNRLNMSKYAGAEDPKPTIEEFSKALDDASQINLNVMEVMGRDVSITEKYHLLRAEEENLNEEDFKYIVLNGEGKLKEWAESKVK